MSIIYTSAGFFFLLDTLHNSFFRLLFQMSLKLCCMRLPAGVVEECHAASACIDIHLLFILKDSHHLTQTELLVRSREAFHILKMVDLKSTYGLWQSNEVYFDYPSSKTEMTTGAVLWHTLGSGSASGSSTRPAGLAMPV